MARFFIDLGAYQGDTLQIAMQEFKDTDTFYAFEPHPEHFEQLRRKFEAFSNVTLLNAAADVRDAEAVPLYCRTGDRERDACYRDVWGEGHSLCAEKWNVGREAVIYVKTVDISNFIERLCSHADTVRLKLDVEGKEYDLLEKMLRDNTLKHVMKLFCEWHWDRIGMPKRKHDKLVRALQRFGFKISGINAKDEFLQLYSGKYQGRERSR